MDRLFSSSLFLATHSASSSFLSFVLPLIGISITERFRDRGYDVAICFDNLANHSRSYRQIALIMGKIPSRDAYPADIFNIHSSLLERSGKLKSLYYFGTISAFPIVETINSDITDFINTNLISITDGQLFTSKSLFLDSFRPAIDTSLSVTRIGSNAQCRLIKYLSTGLKTQLSLSHNVFTPFSFLITQNHL
jgi:F-type H+-transporting ATPase subunit alpha